MKYNSLWWYTIKIPLFRCIDYERLAVRYNPSEYGTLYLKPKGKLEYNAHMEDLENNSDPIMTANSIWCDAEKALHILLYGDEISDEQYHNY